MGDFIYPYVSQGRHTVALVPCGLVTVHVFVKMYDFVDMYYFTYAVMY